MIALLGPWQGPGFTPVTKLKTTQVSRATHLARPYNHIAVNVALGADRIGFFETGPDRTGSRRQIRFAGPDRITAGPDQSIF